MIPRLIHRVWLGDAEPEWTAAFAETWRRPGWELVTWGDEDVRKLVRRRGPLVNQDIYDRAEQIAPRHIGQLRSDVLRYELLWEFGGVYVDADLECLVPIDELVEGLECFAAWEVQDRWIANGFMGAREQHPFIGRLIDGLAFNVRLQHGHKPNRMTGPQYLTTAWTRYGRAYDVEVLPQHLVYPYGWREISVHGPGEPWPGAYTSHHWNNKRRERGISA